MSQLITFRYAAEGYIRDRLPAKAERTQKDNLHELKWLYKFFDNPPSPLEQIDPIHVRQYMDWRVSAKVRANRGKALFSAIWNYAREKGLTNRENPCKGVKNYKEKGRDIYIDDELLDLVYKFAEVPLQNALDLAYLTGQRPADVLKLKRSDVKDGALWIRQNKGSAKLRINIEGLLDDVMKRISSAKVMSLKLLNNVKGEPLTKYMLRGAFDRARAAAKEAHPEIEKEIKAFQFRDLRAKAGTDKEESQGMNAAQAQLGHTTPTMTAHYVRHRKGKLVNPTK
ncbi:tyrosine-type recombinase/integrase [Undibacterium sp. JH2W]|uniref:tyrosine-type recombinase/integrase n=1 Tax=Undibacterium sp. JH2W TaxID=3413037 RepID=UPI003BEF92FC